MRSCSGSNEACLSPTRSSSTRFTRESRPGLNSVSSRDYGPPVNEPLNTQGEASSQREKRAPEHWILLSMAAATLLGLIVLGVFVAPDDRGYGTHEQLGLPACGVMKVTGIPCPGCGVTTSVALAASGRFADSFVNQPFGLLTALAGAFFVLYSAWTHFSGGEHVPRIHGCHHYPV